MRLAGIALGLTGLALMTLAGCRQDDTSATGAASRPAAHAATAAEMALRTQLEVDAAEPLPTVDLNRLPPGVQRKIGAARQAATTDPDDNEKLLSLAQMYYTHGFRREAAACFSHVAARMPTPDETTLYCLGVAWQAAGAPEKAAVPLRLATEVQERRIADDPNLLSKRNTALLLRYGMVLLDTQGDLARARQLFEQALEDRPDHPVAFYGLGCILKERGATEEAQQRFEQALATYPAYTAAQRALGRSEPTTGAADDDEAETTSDAASPLSPLETMRWVDALETAMLRKGFDRRTWLRDAGMLRQARQPEEALKALDVLREVHGEDGDQHNVRGQVLLQMRRYADAAEQFRAGLAVQPQRRGLAINLSFALVGMNQADEALALLQKFHTAKPEVDRVLERYARLLNQLGRADEAQRLVLQAMQNQPQDARQQFLGGVLLSEFGLREQAAQALEYVLKLDPTFAEAHYELGLYEQSRGDMAAARRHWEAAIAAHPAYEDPRLELTRVLLRNREYGPAAKLLREGVAALPGSDSFAIALAWILATCPDDTLRNGSEAVQLARRVAEHYAYAEPAPLDTLAAACAEVGAWDDACRFAAAAAQAAEQKGQASLATEIRARLAGYQQQQPHRDRPRP